MSLRPVDRNYVGGIFRQNVATSHQICLTLDWLELAGSCRSRPQPSLKHQTFRSHTLACLDRCLIMKDATPSRTPAIKTSNPINTATKRTASHLVMVPFKKKTNAATHVPGSPQIIKRYPVEYIKPCHTERRPVTAVTLLIVLSTWANLDIGRRIASMPTNTSI